MPHLEIVPGVTLIKWKLIFFTLLFILYCLLSTSKIMMLKLPSMVRHSSQSNAAAASSSVSTHCLTSVNHLHNTTPLWGNWSSRYSLWSELALDFFLSHLLILWNAVHFWLPMTLYILPVLIKCLSCASHSSVAFAILVLHQLTVIFAFCIYPT